MRSGEMLHGHAVTRPKSNAYRGLLDDDARYITFPRSIVVNEMVYNEGPLHVLKLWPTLARWRNAPSPVNSRRVSNTSW